MYVQTLWELKGGSGRVFLNCEMNLLALVFYFPLNLLAGAIHCLQLCIHPSPPLSAPYIGMVGALKIFVGGYINAIGSLKKC